MAQENATLKKELEKSQKSEETANNAKEWVIDISYF